MEILGGAPFMDGEWESICRILSFDQDSDLSNSISDNIPHEDDDSNVDQSLLGLLMGNANPLAYNLSQSSCSDVSNGAYCHQFVQPYCNDDDQFSSLSSSNTTTSFGFLARNGSFVDENMINANGNHSTKKRNRVMDNRKIQTKKTKKEAPLEERKSICESSDNESNGSEEVINEEAIETPCVKGKKKARGGATDPQSLYARKRRERINERLRILQNLVPNGTKVDISTMLEEAVNYVKFLQLQIKLLSSDEMWMYAPLAYNGFDGDLYKSF